MDSHFSNAACKIYPMSSLRGLAGKRYEWRMAWPKPKMDFHQPDRTLCKLWREILMSD